MRRGLSRAVVIALVVWLGGLAGAKAEEQAAAPTPEQVQQWVRQLDADEFAAREEATAKLAEAGAAALPAVEEAARSDSAETASRALNVLKRWLESENEALKTSAQGVVEKLAESDQPALARRAKALLEATKPAPSSSPRALPGGGLRFVPGFGGARIELRVEGFAGGKRGRITRVTVTDGVKKVEVTDGDLKIEAVEDPDKGIEMKVTQPVDGKDKTTEYKAKDADDLKEKHEEAHKLYEKYIAGAKAGIRIEAAGILAPRPDDKKDADDEEGADPKPAPGRKLRRLEAPEFREDAAEVRKAMEALREAVKNGADEATRQKLIEEVRAATAKLRAARDE